MHSQLVEPVSCKMHIQIFDKILKGGYEDEDNNEYFDYLV